MGKEIAQMLDTLYGAPLGMTLAEEEKMMEKKLKEEADRKKKLEDFLGNYVVGPPLLPY